jgi:hypothetical protein
MQPNSDESGATTFEQRAIPKQHFLEGGSSGTLSSVTTDRYPPAKE